MVARGHAIFTMAAKAMRPSQTRRWPDASSLACILR